MELHNLSQRIPSFEKVLAHAQKMLDDVNKGEIVDIKLILYLIQIAVKGLRIAFAFNNT